LHEVVIRLHRRCMIAIFPESALSALPPVVFLSGSSRGRLNTLGNDRSAMSVINEEMYVIGSCHVIENDTTKPLLGLEKPVNPPLAILGEFQ
jgi:hypothetical protein